MNLNRAIAAMLLPVQMIVARMESNRQSQCPRFMVLNRTQRNDSRKLGLYPLWGAKPFIKLPHNRTPHGAPHLVTTKKTAKSVSPSAKHRAPRARPMPRPSEGSLPPPRFATRSMARAQAFRTTTQTSLHRAPIFPRRALQPTKAPRWRLKIRGHLNYRASKRNAAN